MRTIDTISRTQCVCAATLTAWTLINAAQKFVKIVCYSLDPEALAPSLDCALNRGVEVTIVSDQVYAHRRCRRGQSRLLRTLPMCVLEVEP